MKTSNFSPFTVIVVCQSRTMMHHAIPLVFKSSLVVARKAGTSPQRDPQRKRKSTHTAAMPPPSSRPLDGLVWPLVPNSKKEGDRSTTWANKQALAAAIGAVDPALAARVLSEPKWRQKYTRYVAKHVEACLQSKEAAVASSKAGLEWVHGHFEFVRDGKSMKLAEAMSSITASFETGFLAGTKPKPTATVLEVCVPVCMCLCSHLCVVCAPAMCIYYSVVVRYVVVVFSWSSLGCMIPGKFVVGV